MDIKNLIIFILLGAIWGASFLFMRVGVPEIGVYSFAGLRVGIAGLCMLPFLLNKKVISEFKNNFKRLFVVGIIGYAVPFSMFSYAAKYLSSGMSSVLNASVPVIASIFAYLLLKESISKRQTLGIIIGIFGVSILIYTNLSANISGFTPIAMALLACICYGFNASFVKQKLSNVSSITITSAGLVIAGIASLPMTICSYPYDKHISMPAILSVVAVAVLSTSLALYLFNILVKQIGPVKTSMVTFIIPIFGILFGIIFLNEKLTINIVIGAAVILFSSALSLKRNKHQK